MFCRINFLVPTGYKGAHQYGISVRVKQEQYNVKCDHFFKNLFFLLGMAQTNLVYRNDDQERVYRHCKFYDQNQNSLSQTFKLHFK